MGSEPHAIIRNISRGAVGGTARSLRWRAIEDAGAAGDGGLSPHRPPDLLLQPKVYVAPHAHSVREHVHHVLEGEGLMEISVSAASCAGTTSSSSHRALSTRSTIPATPTSFPGNHVPARRRLSVIGRRRNAAGAATRGEALPFLLGE
jgi:hypothetical protein